MIGLRLGIATAMAVVVGAACAPPVDAVPPAEVGIPPAAVAAGPASPPAATTAATAVDAPSPAAPFAAGQTWIGEYTCRQGLTELRLRSQSLRGAELDALFEFRHPPTSVDGKFELTGLYDPGSRRAVLAPEAWLQQPPGYIMVGMDGKVSEDGRTFSGRISTEGCTTFSVRLR